MSNPHNNQNLSFPFVGMLAYSEPAGLTNDFLVADGSAIVDPIAYPLVTTILNAQRPDFAPGAIAYSPTLDLFVAADVGVTATSGAPLGFWYSSNGINWTLGATFISIFDTDNVSNAAIYDIAYLNDIFVATGERETGHGVILTSPDGKTWTVSFTSSVNSQLHGAAYGNGKYIVVGYNTATNAAISVKSTNGATWTVGNFTTAATHGLAIAYSDDLTLFAVAASGGKIYTSADDASWSAVTTDTAVTTTDILWNADDGIFAGVASDGKIYTSADGLSFSGASMDNPVTTFIYSSRLALYIGGDGSAIFTSDDTTTWVSAYAHNMESFAESDSQDLIVAGGIVSDVQLATSANGTDWTAVSSGIGLQAYIVPQIYTQDANSIPSAFPAFLKLR